MPFTATHLCLYHECSPPSHVLQVAVDVERVFCPEALCHGVQGNEGSSTPHPCTAVDQEGNPLALVVGLLYFSHKAEDGGGELGYPMVRPGGIVVVSYLEWL